MAFFASKQFTSVFGRRLGLQTLTTNDNGGRLPSEFLAGPEAVRMGVTTNETTATNILPYGVSVLTTAVSSGVYTMDPPIPGVEKTLIFHTTGANPIYVKTKNGEFINSTQGTTMSVITSSQTAYAAVTLSPVSTGAWAVVGSLSSAYLRTSTST